jgi:hypothetical protein
VGAVLTTGNPKKKAKAHKAPSGITEARLAEMIEEATVDAYGESDQVTGWFTMFENDLELPFEVEVFGVCVTVAAIDLRDDNRIVAVCKRGKENQEIEVTELPIPMPRPVGSDWIEAYRRWRGGR